MLEAIIHWYYWSIHASRATRCCMETFIHWCYWSSHASRGLMHMVLVSVGVEGLLRSCLIDLHINNQTTQLFPTGYILLLLFFTQEAMSAVGDTRCNAIKDISTLTLLDTPPWLQSTWYFSMPGNTSVLRTAVHSHTGRMTIYLV